MAYAEEERFVFRQWEKVGFSLAGTEKTVGIKGFHTITFEQARRLYESILATVRGPADKIPDEVGKVINELRSDTADTEQVESKKGSFGAVFCVVGDRGEKMPIVCAMKVYFHEQEKTDAGSKVCFPTARATLGSRISAEELRVALKVDPAPGVLPYLFIQDVKVPIEYMGEKRLVPHTCVLMPFARMSLKDLLDLLREARKEAEHGGDENEIVRFVSMGLAERYGTDFKFDNFWHLLKVVFELLLGVAVGCYFIWYQGGGASGKRVVIGDLKPDNVMLELENGRLVAYVSDYAGMWVEGGNRELPLHTQYYSPAEARRGSSEWGITWDVYSFGVMMWEVVSSLLDPSAGPPSISRRQTRTPTYGDNAVKWRRRRNAFIRKLRGLFLQNGQMTDAVVRFIDDCLRKEPEKRINRWDGEDGVISRMLKICAAAGVETESYKRMLKEYRVKPWSEVEGKAQFLFETMEFWGREILHAWEKVKEYLSNQGMRDETEVKMSFLASVAEKVGATEFAGYIREIFGAEARLPLRRVGHILADSIGRMAARSGYLPDLALGCIRWDLAAFVRGWSCNLVKAYDAAVRHYSACIPVWLLEGDRTNAAAAYNNRGNAWRHKGEYDRAIEDYSKAIELFEKVGDKINAAKVYNNRGNAWDDKGEYDRAIEDYTKAIELKPDDAEAYYSRGIAWDDKGEYDRAIEDYTKAIELFEKVGDKINAAKVYNNRGIAWRHKGEYDRAIEDYTKAIELKRDFAEAWANRAVAYVFMWRIGLAKPGEVENAFREAEKYADMLPDKGIRLLEARAEFRREVSEALEDGEGKGE